MSCHGYQTFLLPEVRVVSSFEHCGPVYSPGTVQDEGSGKYPSPDRTRDYFFYQHKQTQTDVGQSQYRMKDAPDTEGIHA
jgi:hypothetical protein